MTSLSTTANGKNLNLSHTWLKRYLVESVLLRRRSAEFAKLFYLIVLVVLSVSFTCQHSFASTEADRNLLAAAKSGNIASITELLNSGANINIKDDKGETPLHLAVTGGFTSVASILLERGADAGLANMKGVTPLMIAAFKNYTDIVKLLITAKVAVDSESRNGFTALMLASQAGNLEVIKLLLDSGAQIDKKTAQGNSALHSAVYGGKPEAVKLLIDNGADPNSPVAPNQTTPLILGVQRGFDSVVELLLSSGANPDFKLNNGNTALDISVSAGRSSIMRKILPFSKNVSPETAIKIITDAVETGDRNLVFDVVSKKTAISLADRKNLLEKAYFGKNAEIIKLLISQWNEPELVEKVLSIAFYRDNPELFKIILNNNKNIDSKIFYVLIKHDALISGNHDSNNDLKSRRLEIIRALLDYRSVNIRHPSVGQALIKETEYGRNETVEIFLARGADVNYENGKALFTAVCKQNEQLAKLLLDGGANVNARDGEILLRAINGRNANLVKMLLDRGANPNDSEGKIVLTVIRLGDVILLRKLLDKGANPQGPGVKESPLESATGHNRPDMVRLLLEKGADVNKNLSGEKALKSALSQCSANLVKAILDAGINLDNMLEVSTVSGKKTFPLRMRIGIWLQYSSCQKKMFDVLGHYGVKENDFHY